MRRALALVVLALASVSLAQSAEDIAVCGAFTPYTSGVVVLGGPVCVWGSAGNTNPVWASFQWFSKGLWEGNEYGDIGTVTSQAEVCTWSLLTNRYVPERDNRLANWEPYVASGCFGLVNEPEPEPEPEPGDWYCIPEAADYGSIVCYRENSDGTYDGNYSTPCGGANTTYGMTFGEWEDWMDGAADAVLSECDNPVDVIPPDDPSMACTGLDGLACEDTLQDIRHLLSILVNRETTPDVPPPFPGPDVGGGEDSPPFQPPFDNSQPGWEEWRAPEVEAGELEALVLLINTRADEVMAAGAGRLPFGLIGWVPEATIEAAPACVNPSWTILRTTEEIGWCDSAPEAWLAGTGRALSLILATFAFGFAVVRTVAWA